MNVKGLTETSVIPTLYVTTLEDPTVVAVLVDIRAMVETALVNIGPLNISLLKVIAVNNNP